MGWPRWCWDTGWTPQNAAGQIIALSVLLGIINAFDMPARQAFVVEMVERREDLGNAIALNSSLFNGARLIGPTVAGVAIAAIGRAGASCSTGSSYVAVILALLAMRLPPREAQRPHRRVWHELGEGFRYTFGFAPIRALMLLVGFTSLVGMPYAVLMPVFATTVFGGGAQTLGYLMAAAEWGRWWGRPIWPRGAACWGLGRSSP